MVAAMTGWWFTAVPRARVAWMRTAVYAFVWIDLLVMRPWVADHGWVPGELYRPLAIGRLLPLPTPTETVVAVVGTALLVLSAVAASGRLPRLAGAAVAVLYLEWMVIAFSYGKVDHDRLAFLVALAVLPTVGAARHRDTTPDERAGWALRCVQVAVVATYLLAAVAKNRYGGGVLTWVDSTTLLRAVVRRGTQLGDLLAERPWTLHGAQYLIVGFELLSPVALLPGRAGRAMLAVFAAFHAVTFAAITIAFWPHLLCLLAFLPLERLAARAGRLGRRLPGVIPRSGSRQPEVTF